MDVQGQDRVLEYLGRLLHQPPKALLLEGGGAGERARIAQYWAAALNCHAAQKPCAACPACLRIAEGEFTDLHYLDGREGRIGIDAVRDLRPLLGQAPRDGGRRVIILGEAQEMTPEAANALLTSMEDTDARNYFVLLAPQRERLLPTLVSRSWAMTLGWNHPGQGTRSGAAEAGEAGEAGEWSEALLTFLKTGRGWFARTMAKSAKAQVDRALAARLIMVCRSNLIQAMHQSPRTNLAAFFCEQGNPDAWRAMDLRLNQAEQALMAHVSAVVVLDWMVVGLRLHILQKQGSPAP